VRLRGPGGIDRFFADNGDGTYTAIPGDQGTLSLAEGKYRLTELDQSVWQFRSDSLLDHVEDSNGNRITLGYASGQLTSLTHSNGDQLLIDYNTDGQVWHVIDPVGADPTDDRVVSYEYDVSGEYLVAVTLPGEYVTRYSYESSNGLQREHALQSVEYSDGTHDYFTYGTAGRLIETHVGGGAESFQYAYDSAGTITVTDATSRKTILSFGVGGQLIKVRDGTGNTLGLTYDGDYHRAHRRSLSIHVRC